MENYKNPVMKIICEYDNKNLNKLIKKDIIEFTYIRNRKIIHELYDRYIHESNITYNDYKYVIYILTHDTIM